MLQLRDSQGNLLSREQMFTIARDLRNRGHQIANDEAREANERAGARAEARRAAAPEEGTARAPANLAARAAAPGRALTPEQHEAARTAKAYEDAYTALQHGRSLRHPDTRRPLSAKGATAYLKYLENQAEKAQWNVNHGESERDRGQR
jgi:hypothetical protein